jgi:hypothetical protein
MEIAILSKAITGKTELPVIELPKIKDGGLKITLDKPDPIKLMVYHSGDQKEWKLFGGFTHSGDLIKDEKGNVVYPSFSTNSKIGKYIKIEVDGKTTVGMKVEY